MTEQQTQVQQPGGGAPQQLTAAQSEHEAELARLRAENATLKAGRTKANNESAKRRLALRETRQQTGTVEDRLRRAESDRRKLRREVEELRQGKDTERTALLATMSQEDQTAFAGLPHDQLKVVHAKLYGRAQQAQQTTDATKPVNATQTAGSSLESALASGDSKAILKAFDEELAAGKAKRHGTTVRQSAEPLE